MSLTVHVLEIVESDDSLYNAVIELVESGANSHTIYEKLVEGLLGVRDSGGFPPHVFEGLLLSKLREVERRVRE